MKNAKNIARLQKLTELILDAELTKLRQAEHRRADTVKKIEGLRVSPAMLDDNAGPADAIAALRYQTWAENRRAELQQVLAAQTAVWMDQRDVARQAFGKARGFESVIEKFLAKT